MLGDLFGGFAALANPETFLYLVGGFVMGLVFGAIPGLTATLAIALLLPFTFAMELTNALVMVMAIFMSGIYAGSVTGIIVNIPGAASGAITTMEGHVMMKRGHGAKALGLDALASSIGGVVGALVLMFVAVPMSRLALLFQTPDKFALVFLAVVTVAIVARGSIWKSIIAVTLGLMVSTVGFDNMVAKARFVFGSADLIEGVQLLPAVIGLFAVCELLVQAGSPPRGALDVPEFKVTRRDFVPRWSEIREIGFWTYVKSSVIGVLVGMLPGGGASMASFVAYAEAKRVSKKPQEYGDGSHEGLAAAESANNAMCGGAVVPLLTLGIPGDSVTAIIFGVLLIHGLVPGPGLLTNEMATIAPMFAALLVAATFVFLSVILFGPWYIWLARLNRGVLYAFIAMIAMVGTYASTYSVFQMWVAFAIGGIAFGLRLLGYPLVPMLMGIILGPYMELYMRRALITANGDPTVFFESPISLALYALTGVFIYFLRIRARPVA
ncbi:tripartite tricarboxylate transporter permease [Salipiger mucosus]|uniref:Tricarboxylate transport membrane protein TctA n=1 Tax=Salipiger mucosus DSM 16094 TaxID=1123237 RepID=S9QWB2_9RHOB|nr:tripartite tricarboxylate transporter permease [Salipiger mucosus]EPX85646.1 Tricarboxylate transport membrane protein TctA [Salipiger mucosus DSM 16094]